MQRPIINKYDPMVYPRILWVANKIEGLNKVFDFAYVGDNTKTSTEAYEEVLKVEEDATMITCPVVKKEGRALGVLVVLLDYDEDLSVAIPHEAVHVADYICDELGIVTQGFNNGNEAYAYLVGWAAGCISTSVTEFKK